MKRVCLVLAFVMSLQSSSTGAAQEVKQRTTIETKAKQISALAVASDGETVAVAVDGKSVSLWNVSNGEKTTSIPGDFNGVVSLSFSNDGQFLAVIDAEGSVLLWSIAAGKTISHLVGAAKPDGGVIIWPGNKKLAYVVIGTERAGLFKEHWNEVRLADVSTAEEEPLHRVRWGEVLPGIPPVITCLALSADGKTLAVGSPDPGGRGQVKFVDVATKEVVRTMSPVHQPISLAFGPDDKTLVVSDGGITVWDVETGKTPGEAKEAGDYPLIAANGKTIASRGVEGKVTVWSVSPQPQE